MITPIALFLLPIVLAGAVNFSPNVTIRSCHSRTVVVDVENAEEGGLVYIQGRGEQCRRYTTSQKNTYRFDFNACRINYDSKFRVVIQRHAGYQTGTDKVIPVMCLVDTSDIHVSSVVFPEETMDGAVNKTIRPIIDMNLLSENESAVIDEVTLNDRVKLSLQLNSQYTGNKNTRGGHSALNHPAGIFDIKATNCSASFIPILKNECSIDDELFPNFVRMSQGQIVSTFNAFQPTNLPGDTEIEVGFTCTVSVCKGTCEQTICGEIVGWGRRRRQDSTSKQKIIEDVTLTTKLKIKPKVNRKTAAITGERTEYCAGKTAVTTVTGIVIIVLVCSWGVCGCALCKLRLLGKKASSGPRMPSAIRRISEINSNFAKSVGRRLSTFFMPTGYDVRDPGIVDGVPAFDTPPSKRRDSVTVSIESAPVLRKRCVSSATQTTEFFNENKQKSDRHVNAHAPSSFRLFEDSCIRRGTNPITSISISSASTKSDRSSIKQKPVIARQNSASVVFNENAVAHTRPKRALTISDPLGFSNEGLVVDSDESIIQYDMDEIPKTPKPFFKVTQNARQVHDTTNVVTPYRGIITLCGDETESSDHDEKVLEPITNSNDIPESKVDLEYLSSDTIKAKLHETKQFENIGFDSSASSCSEVDENETVSRIDSLIESAADVVDGNPELVDDTYGVIEIGDQVKRDRLYSTHV